MTQREKPQAVEATDAAAAAAAGTVLHAAEVTQDVAGAMKAEVSVTKAGRTEESAKTSNAVQDVTVFEGAEEFGARFESFWNRCWSNVCAYDETSEFTALPPNYVLLC